MPAPVQLDIRSRVKKAYHISSYVLLAIFSLIACFYFLYLAIASDNVGENYLLWTQGGFSLLSLALYGALLLCSFLPLKQTFAHFKALDILAIVLRFALLASASLMLTISCLREESAFFSFFRAYAIFLLAFEAIFLIFSFLSLAWYAENKDRYHYEEKDGERNLPDRK